MEVGTRYVKSLKDVDIGPERGLSGSAGSAVCGRAGMSWLCRDVVAVVAGGRPEVGLTAISCLVMSGNGCRQDG
jgi:hypothetical protein